MSYPHHLTPHPALPVPDQAARSLQRAVRLLIWLSVIPTLATIAAGVALFGYSMTWQPGDDSLLVPFLGVAALGVLAAAALWSGMVGWAILLGFRRVAGYAAMPGTVQGLLAFLAGGLTGAPIMIVMYQAW